MAVVPPCPPVGVQEGLGLARLSPPGRMTLNASVCAQHLCPQSRT